MLQICLIILTLGFCYSFSIAPGLTWAHFSADGGDFISALVSGGVPHPAGYPLYLLLARPFQLIPFGNLAFRTNVFSALVTILAAVLLYVFLKRLLTEKPWSGFISAFSAIVYGLTPFVWGQALVTEVYALHGLLLIACMFAWSIEPGKINEWLRGFFFGLAASNHLTSVLLFPMLLLNSSVDFRCSARTVLSRMLGVLSGLAIYLLLPLRAMSKPVVNWGDVSTPAGFIWLVSGRLYNHYLWDLPGQDLLVRLKSVPGVLLEQYTWLGVLLALFGLFSLRSNAFRLATLWVVISTICFAVLYGSMDSQVYLLPVWVVFALWMAFGLQDVLEGLRNYPRVQGSLCVFLLILMLLRIPATFRLVDVSHDRTAMEFITNSLANIPPDALVMIDGDQTTFSLWYAQIGEQRRMDIRFVASGLLPFDWYVHSLGRLYPDLKIPELAYISAADIISANPGRTLCVLTDEKPLRCDP